MEFVTGMLIVVLTLAASTYWEQRKAAIKLNKFLDEERDQ